MDLNPKAFSGGQCTIKHASLMHKWRSFSPPMASVLCELIFLCNQDEVAKRIRTLLERLQAWVDPFDLDVFMPYVLSNIENQLSKSSVSCCPGSVTN